jgi:beta-galactosidase/beta-glucuronidase
MGFNGCRKHQVVADPRFLYHADRLGYLVWGEMANCVNFDRTSASRMTKEWNDVVLRDLSHPCIVAWVPINESWGVPDIQHDPMQQHHALSLYHLTKALDPSRPVISNDGWEMVETDLCAIHNYAHGKQDEPERQTSFREALRTKEGMLSYLSAGRNIYAKGHAHRGEPILLTEFGGIAYQNRPEGWGYTQVKNETSFAAELERLYDAIRASECLRGYCYTQLTDVFQEENGLLTFDRKFKIDPDRIKRLNDSIQPTVRKTKTTKSN